MPLIQRVASWMRKVGPLVFGLDTRSLAIGRILLGGIAVLDVVSRVADYRFFYTEEGALPRAAVMQYLQRLDHISLFMASGANWWAGACFALEVVAAVAFMVGYRTRQANIMLWAMVIGSQARGSILLQAGDVVLRLLLFWCMFLPMGTRLSVDRLAGRLESTVPRQVLSVATTALQFQLAAIYIWSSLLKTGAPWRNGEAVWYALNLDHFAKQPLASMLLDHEAIWRMLTHATYAWEMAGPWLLLTPFLFGPLRTLVVAGFVAMHLGFSAGLELGLFTWICIAGWIVLLPGWLWDKLGWPVAAAEVEPSCPGLPWARRAGSRWGIWGRYSLSQVPAFFFLWLIFQWNMSTIDARSWSVPKFGSSIGHTLRLDQRWDMFAPVPFTDDGWFVIPGELANGEFVELWQGGDVAWASDAERATWTRALEAPKEAKQRAYDLSRQKPALVSAMYPNQRWRKYMRNLWLSRYRALRLYYGKAVCKQWNREHSGGEKLRRFNMVYMKEATPRPGGTSEVVPVQTWSHQCFKPKK